MYFAINFRFQEFIKYCKEGSVTTNYVRLNSISSVWDILGWYTHKATAIWHNSFFLYLYTNPN